MKRLLTMICAVIGLAGPLGLAGTAAARDHDGGGEPRAERPRGEAAGGGWRAREDRGAPREERVYADPRAYRGERSGRDQDDPRAYRADPRGGYGPPPAYYGAPAPRRGGYLPPQAGGPVADYGRYRLRPPPPGYSWVRTGNGYAMVRGDTGQVFDIVPY